VKGVRRQRGREERIGIVGSRWEGRKREKVGRERLGRSSNYTGRSVWRRGRGEEGGL